jgi:hypothetical protein
MPFLNYYKEKYAKMNGFCIDDKTKSKQINKMVSLSQNGGLSKRIVIGLDYVPNFLTRVNADNQRINLISNVKFEILVGLDGRVLVDDINNLNFLATKWEEYVARNCADRDQLQNMIREGSLSQGYPCRHHLAQFSNISQDTLIRAIIEAGFRVDSPTPKIAEPPREGSLNQAYYQAEVEAGRAPGPRETFCQDLRKKKRAHDVFEAWKQESTATDHNDDSEITTETEELPPFPLLIDRISTRPPIPFCDSSVKYDSKRNGWYLN